ncbi:MAG: hypothetical protein IJ722_00300 [Alloprevotella sp.]|nr:hypothetical protein [Alloprevotella sp.]
MKQKLHLLLPAVLLAWLWGAPARTAAQIVPADNEIWWGYYHDTDNLLGFGSGEVERYDCAIHTGRNNAQLTGHKIRAVRFVVRGVSTMQNVKVWLSTALPDTPDDANVCSIAVATGDLQDGKPTEVLLPEPYTVGAEGVYVGYTLTQTYIGTMEQGFPILTTDHEDDVTGSLYMKSNRNFPSWSTFGGLGYGRMAIQVLVDGDYPTHSLAVADFGDGITLANDSVQVPVTLTNYGTKAVTDFDYTISTNGSAEFTRHITLDKPLQGYACSAQTLLTFIADPTNGRQQKTITVTKVNGESNTITAGRNVASGTLITLESSAPHRSVYEEFTATWSGGSPRGFTGQQKLATAYPEDAIWISVHCGSDPMAVADYQGVFNRIGLAPSGLMNRTLRADPYYGSQLPRNGFGLDKDVEADQKAVSEAAISLSAPQMDKNGHIRFSTDVLFHYDRDDAPYALGFVLLADGLKSDATEWNQANSYPNWTGTTIFDTNDPDLYYWAKQGTVLSNVEYNNVAIAAEGVEKGIAGTIKAPIRMGETQNYSHEMELGFNKLAQNLYRLSIVALLFNTETGEIVNAAKQPVNVSDEFVGTSATAADFSKLLALAGQQAEIPIVVENYGKQDISALDITVQMDDLPAATAHVEVSPALSFGNKRTVGVPVRVPATVKDYATSLTIEKVNGYDNEAPGLKTASGLLRALAEAPLHKTYVEEYTGTWCGFCPRGTLGLRLAEERHPGKAVLTAVHRNDPMEIGEFSSILSGVSGYPSSSINRSYTIDPYMGNKSSGYGLGEIIEAESAKLTEAGITLETPLYDSTDRSVTATATAIFQFNATAAPYALGFLLVADGLTGTGTGWLQHNYYSAYQGTAAYQNDADLQTIIRQPEYMRDPFNHVPIAGAGVTAGIAGSIAAPIQAGQRQSYTHQFSVGGNALCQDPGKLKVIALLFNTETGEVVNAEEAEVKPLTGIGSIQGHTPAPPARYSLDGRRLAAPVPGINILRLPGGEVRKVIIR